MALCSVVFFVATSVLYFILSKLVDKVVGSSFGSAYHWMHPYSFIMVFAVFFMITMLVLGRNKKIVHKNIFYFIFYIFWIVLSLVFCGLLWSFYDMNAGYFPQGYELLKKIFSDMFYGLTWGGLAILGAIPFNLLVFAVSFFIIKNYRAYINNNS
ncbi:hypothetical protein C1637_05935 [Chryseobacterium lactis]|uniref:Uncharacterized protein n=2 Tax=Chryseobacterium lactis TaxID=1241981 RepID=A0A3G6RNH9_CHRLC|nr:hypothetical protein EG342_21905 [Chryseobacterium lactis]AZB04769.1 hypothetical protein EG341_12785 [Chryseobacterium lactis]PNW14499.1 hypothetical protein C1637_05935 [Chryseobacterium lactis]